MPQFEKLQRSSTAQRVFARNVELRGLGANDTSVGRCGNRIVKEGLLAISANFNRVEIDLGVMSIQVHGELAEVQFPITVTARDKERNESFRESNRVALKLQKIDGSWIVVAAENLEPTSFELGTEEGPLKTEPCS